MGWIWSIAWVLAWFVCGAIITAIGIKVLVDLYNWKRQP